MAVAVDSFVADVTSNSVTTKTLGTLTVGAGANRALVVALTLQGSATLPSVTWDSGGTNQAMTLITSQAVTGNVAKLWLYGLIAPTSGTKTLSASWTGTSDVTLAAGALTGVDQTGGATSFAHSSAVAGTGAMSSAVTSAVGNWVVGCFTGNGSISGPSATQWWLDNAPNNFSSVGSQVTGAASVTVSASGPTPWAFVGCDIVAAVASGLPTGKTALTPAPDAPRRGIDLRTWIDPVNLTLLGQDTFFTGPGRGPVYDYPNPRGPIPAITLKTWLDPLKLLLQSQDRFFGLAGNPTTDWPVPKAAQRSISLWTWIDPLKVQLQGQDRFFGLAGNPTTDWPVPKAPARSISLWTWTEPLKILLRSQDTFFGLAGNPTTDWPVPKGYVPGITLRTWIDPLKIQAGTDTFFGLAGNPQLDWPNPKGPPPLNQGWIDQYKLAINNVPISAPFVQGDWPTPKGPLAAIALRTWIDPFKGAGTDTFFGLGGVPQFDWPVPKAAQRSISLWTWTDQLKLTLQGQDQFFGLAGNPTTDWPVPKGPQRSISLWTWTDPLKLLLQSQDTFFGLAGNPQRDWPVPPAARYPSDLRGFVVSLNQLAGQDTFFGLAGNPQHDWPNPWRPAPLLQAWTDQVKFTLNAIVAPFSQGDWPNPSGPVYSIGLKTWIDPFKGQGTDTFFGLAGAPQFDWPVPRGALRGPPPATYISIMPPTPAPTPPVDTSVPGPADGDDDEPYADLARRRWLEWSRNRRKRPLPAVVTPQIEEPARPIVRQPKVRRSDISNNLLAQNLAQVRASMLPALPVAADQTPRVKETVAKVVREMQRIADDDEDDITSFLLGDDW